MPRRDYYAVLRVHHGASEGEIRASYRRLARECHPDLHPEDESASARLKALNEAYEALTKRPESGSRSPQRGYTAPISYTVRWSSPSRRRTSELLWRSFFSGYRLSTLEQMIELLDELDATWELEWRRLRRLLDLL